MGKVMMAAVPEDEIIQHAADGWSVEQVGHEALRQKSAQNPNAAPMTGALLGTRIGDGWVRFYRRQLGGEQ